METRKIKFTKLQSEIFELLCKNTGVELNQSLIASNLGFSSTAVAKSLKEMQKFNLVSINSDKKMNLNLISLNRENNFIVQLKRVQNLKLIYESGILEELEEKFTGATIILFGSYAKGEDTIKSDIDIAIIGRKEKTIGLSKFENFFKKEIIINFYDSMHSIEKELRESLCNGIVLSGGIEL